MRHLTFYKSFDSLQLCCTLKFSFRPARRNASSTTSNQAEINAEIVPKKPESVPEQLSLRMGAQVKTAGSFFMEMMKSTSPLVTSSVLSWAKRMPFLNEAKSESKPVLSVEEEIAQQATNRANLSIPRTKELPAAEKAKVVPKWKVKRKSAVTQESIDNRTKHVISAVAKASTSSSLHSRIDDLCHHLFHYPASKSVASRVRNSS